MTDSNSSGDATLLRIVEALVFAADEPITSAQIAATIVTAGSADGPDETTIEEIVAALNEKYATNGHALRIERWAGGYRMATVESVADHLATFFTQVRSVKLSRPLMETLAILCYRQPVTRVEIEKVRGVTSDYALRRLLELDLIRIAGRAKSIGQPLLYATTDQFLETFGLDSVSDLPSLRDIESLLDDPEFSMERAHLLTLNGLNAPDEAPD